MRAAVLGSPVIHSLSPTLHRAAYAALGLRGWSYTAVECDETRLPDLLDGLDETWAGLSLTMPLKRAVLPLLDEVEPLASDVGGANTVVLSDGRRFGYNTDVGGMVAALADAGVTEWSASRGAVVIGAGATACSALAALKELGVREVVVAVRDTSRTGDLEAAAKRLDVAIRVDDLGSLARSPANTCVAKTSSGAVGLVVCTVPPRAADALVDWLSGGRHSPLVVFDVAYDPWPTRFAAVAAAGGSVIVGGFELLLHQAARQVELMTGHPAPLAAMRAAGLAELAARSGPNT
ncbi:MAG TPA: shikimate dehydrogenase [Streptosporangiaceae bacterium]|nr:shikimate dehydrogenase [Streptosporangiaceae bacterium]